MIDDHEVVRRGVVDLCAAADGLTVVAEAATVAEALRRGAAVRPDIALVDLVLPDGSGADVMHGLGTSSPATRFVVLTTYDDEELYAGSLEAGARAFVLKTVRGEHIVETVRAVASGRVLLDDMVLQRNRAHVEDPLAVLTPSERLVLGCVGEGLSNRETGSRLDITEKTVKNHMTSILAKLGFKRRTQAAAWVIAGSRGGPAGPHDASVAPARPPLPWSAPAAVPSARTRRPAGG